MMLAYHAQLNSADDETRLKAAKAWAKWEYVFIPYPLLKSVGHFSTTFS